MGGRGGRAADGEADDAVVFEGSNSLWVSLVVITVLAVPMALWLSAGAFGEGGPGAVVGPLLIGGGIVALLALGAWFAWRQKREVTLDRAGVTIRAGDGTVRAHLPWEEIIGIEERRLPSQPLQPAVIFHRADGTALLLDAQQVRDTGTLFREAQRRHRNAERGGRGAE